MNGNNVCFVIIFEIIIYIIGDEQIYIIGRDSICVFVYGDIDYCDFVEINERDL